jgi:hypothetical protein
MYGFGMDGSNHDFDISRGFGGSEVGEIDNL